MKTITIAQGRDLALALIAAGVLPPNCRRFLIDSGEPGSAVKVFYECYGDDRLLDAFVTAGITTKTESPA